MDIIGIIMLVLTYVLIGFGFAGGFALFRWVSRKMKARRDSKRARILSGGSMSKSSRIEKL